MISDCLPSRGPVRRTVQVQVANLTEEERDVLQAVVAVFADPGLRRMRDDLMAGRTRLEIDDGVPTWTRRDS